MEQVTLITISLDELKSINNESVKEALKSILVSNQQRLHDIEPVHSIKLDVLYKMYSWKRQTVYGWVHNRLIPNSKIGKTLYFNVAEIEKWIATGRRKTLIEIEEDANTYLRSRKK